MNEIDKSSSLNQVTPVAARLTQPSILPRLAKLVAVLLMLRKCVGVVLIARDPPGELLRQEFECTQPGLVRAVE